MDYNHTPSKETPCVVCKAHGFLKYGFPPARCDHHHEVNHIMCSGGDSVNAVKACTSPQVLSEVSRLDRRKTMRLAAVRRLIKLQREKTIKP